jgi:hypothetical protein
MPNITSHSRKSLAKPFSDGFCTVFDRFSNRRESKWSDDSRARPFSMPPMTV